MPHDQPIPDMRNVNLVSIDGLRYASRQNLCERCGRLPTCSDAPLKQLRRKEGKVMECSLFEPVIPFRPPLIGFQSTFNTFRMGEAWMKRVQPGTVIALYDGQEHRVFGHARVLFAVSGNKEEMCAAHGAANHLLIGQPEDSAIRDKMLLILRRIYGKLIYEANDKCTVIYMERLDGS